jgi:hypothetical protein
MHPRNGTGRLKLRGKFSGPACALKRHFAANAQKGGISTGVQTVSHLRECDFPFTGERTGKG